MKDLGTVQADAARSEARKLEDRQKELNRQAPPDCSAAIAKSSAL